jgi:transcriptional antiterminator
MLLLLLLQLLRLLLPEDGQETLQQVACELAVDERHVQREQVVH